MKFLRLDLAAFGPFTDLSLDLSGGTEGLHVIYGPNEAGKSSALRAVRRLLYGIPARSADNFVHPYSKLRIGAVLRHSDGSVLGCIRRKGRRKTLRGADDQTSLDEAELERHLAGVDEDLFETMFGIDHERLVQGGREIVQGGGRLGEILFAAGSGAAELRSVQGRLQEEMDALFKGGNASKPRINAGLGRLRDVQRGLKQAQLSVDEWQEHERRLRRAEARQQELEQELRAQRARRNRLIRIRDARPAITQWKAATQELQAHRDAVLLPEDFGTRRNEALSRLQLAGQQKQEAEQSRERFDGELEQLEVPEDLLSEAETVGDLHQRLGSHLKAENDRSGLVADQRRCEQDAHEILQRLGRPVEPDEIKSLRIPDHKKARIQELAQGEQGFARELEAARRRCERLGRQIAETEGRVAETEVSEDPAPLRRCVQAVREQGNLERQLVVLEGELQRCENDADVSREQMRPFTGDLDKFERLPVPAEETLDRFESQFQESAARLESLRGRQEVGDHPERPLMAPPLRFKNRAHPAEDGVSRKNWLSSSTWTGMALVGPSWSGQGMLKNPRGALRWIWPLLLCSIYGCGGEDRHNPQETQPMSASPSFSERPLSERRGFAPEWYEEHGSFVDILVRAPCEAVIEALQKHNGVEGPAGNLLSGPVKLPLDQIDYALFVYQLNGHEWTQLEGYNLAIYPELAPFLSEHLDVLVFRDQYEDTGGAFGYDIFDDGELVESYYAAEGLYDGEDGQAERQRKLAEGWLIDSTNSYAFFSKRGRSFDIESPQEPERLPERVARDLGMYVLTSAWWAETDSREVEPFADVKREDFKGAYLLRLRF